MNDIVQAPRVETPKPDPLLEAFRIELATLCDAPLDAKGIHKILTTAQAAQQVLLLRNPRSVRRCGNNFVGPSIGPYGTTFYGAMDPMDDGETSAPMPNPIAPFQNTETFGATMVREIVSALRPPEQSTADLVRALADARKLGMDDVAEKLFASLQSRVDPKKVEAAKDATVVTSSEVTP